MPFLSLPLIVFALSATAEPLNFGPPQAFSWEKLITKAEQNSQRAYQQAPSDIAQLAEKIDFPAHSKIHYRPDHALFKETKSVYTASFYHLGQLFKKRVRIHTLESGSAREVLYSPSYFDMPADSPARALPANAGFAGFQVTEAKNSKLHWELSHWVSFLGASYFRAIGGTDQWGLSARGIAVNTGMSEPEEFPDFTEFYIEGAEQTEKPIVVYALLEGPSVTGAYRFTIYRGVNTTMDVEVKLFARKDIKRLGIAPLTSMFWFDEKNREYGVDWRPEVHDSDGLAMWTGDGERLWRPLNNAPYVITNAFGDKHPKGFGLSQRDRNPEHYLDAVYYERRPSVWIEPLSDFGEGSVHLVEIPTNDEIYDNIAAMWVPKAPVKAGDKLSFNYRMHWSSEEPKRDEHLARGFATRIGAGGHPGQPRPPGVVKFMVEFSGGDLAQIPGSQNMSMKPAVWSSRGEVMNVFPSQVPDTDKWRVEFDLKTDDSVNPIDLRVELNSKDGKRMTESWLYQYHPRRR